MSPTLQNPPSIQLLPEHLIDQIKAGEIIERPANVLKELMENALDAGASQVDVELEESGLGLIRVSDDGHGIRKDDLMLAFGRHATSKIRRFDDLYRLSTFGFRGEALPSIASVSKFECASWVQASASGGLIRFEGSECLGVHEAHKSGREHGTVMSVSDLFHNTPVRLKLIQSQASEKNALKRYFYAFLLGRPDVTFSIQWDKEERLIYPKTDGHISRIRQLFTARSQDKIQILEAKRTWQDLSCHVLVVNTHGARSEGPITSVCVNYRPIYDKAYARVTQQALDKLGVTETPQVLILIQVPSEQVDVNVHPHKTLVKFHQTNDVLSLVSSTLQEALGQPGPRPITSAPMLLDASYDLGRDRGESYSYHLHELTGQNELPLSADADGPLFTKPGPYWMWLRDSQDPWYVDGKKLLSLWFGSLLQKASLSTPLLVSHPLRQTTLSSSNIEQLSDAGFELEQLESDFLVFRSIPDWAQGIPLSVLIPLCLKQLGLHLECAPFHFHEVASSVWDRAWSEVGVANLLSHSAARLVTEKG